MQDESQPNKIVIKGLEYEKIKTIILHFVKDMERQGKDFINLDKRPKFGDIIEYYLEQNLENIENESEAAELTTKLEYILNNLIDKESILIVTNDAEDPAERVLSLNINFDPVSY